MPSTCSTYSQYCCTCCSQQTKRHTLQGGKEYLSQERVGSSGAQKGCGWLGGLPRQMSARKNMMQARTDRAARLRRGARRQSCCSVTASGRATPGQPAQQVSHPDASHKDPGMPLRRLPSASSLYWVPLESLYTCWWHLLCMHGVLLLHLTRTACGKREKKGLTGGRPAHLAKGSEQKLLWWLLPLWVRLAAACCKDTYLLPPKERAQSARICIHTDPKKPHKQSLTL